MNCPQCGTPLDRNQQFCHVCGAHVPPEQAQDQQSQGTASVTQTAPVAAPQPQPQQPPQKSRLVAVLATLCAVLLVALVCVGLVAGGVIPTGGQGKTEPQEESTEAVAAKSTTSEVAKKEAGKEAEEGLSGASEQPSPTEQTTVAEPAPNPEPEPEPAQAESAPAPSQGSGYVLPDSATHYYTWDELAGLSDWDLYIARNEIYARHGRGFVRQNLRDHFATCSWYTETYDPEYFDANIEPTMSDCEVTNIHTILDLEHYRGSPYP